MAVQRQGLSPKQILTFHSELVGIVQRTFFRLHDVTDLHMISAGAKTARAEPLIGAPTSRDSGGEGHDRHQALAAATGESLERYSAGWIDESRLVHGSAKQLANQGLSLLSPDRVQFFTSAQLANEAFGMTQLDSDTETPWIESAEVSTGRRVHLPAQLAYLAMIPGAPRIHSPTSNGLAFDTNPYGALLSGMLELVERDAFMLTWYYSLAMPRIDLGSGTRLKQFMVRHVHPTGLRVRVMDLSSFTGLPVVMSVARPSNGDPGPVGVGASAALNPELACIKAIIEAIGSRSWSAQRRRQGVKARSMDNWAERVVNFEDHIDLFASPDMYGHLDFLDSSTAVRPVTDIPSLDASPSLAVARLSAHLNALGISVYSVDVTSPDVREGGGYVIRAFSPDLQPLDVTYRHRYLGHQRLHSPSVTTVVMEHHSHEVALNRTPHPFP